MWKAMVWGMRRRRGRKRRTESSRCDYFFLTITKVFPFQFFIYGGIHKNKASLQVSLFLINSNPAQQI